MRRQRPALVVVGAVACLAACSGPLEVDSPELSGAAAAACAAFIESLPQRVGDEERREVDGDYAAAYGDPPIVVRCGVPPLEGMLTDCMTVEGVDWYFVGADADSRTAWTIGREPTVGVTIPLSFGASAGPLVDLAEAVKGATKSTEPCR